MKKMLLLVLSLFSLALRPQEADGRILSREQKPHFGNNHVVTTIQTDHGDIFDCVDIHNQPSFSHPLLKGHELQMRPSFLASEDVNDVKSARKPLPIGLKNGGCPKGSVPVLRLHKHLTFGNSTEKRGTMDHPHVHTQESTTGFSSSIAYYSIDHGKFYGTGALLNLWSPSVAADQFTGVKIMVFNSEQKYSEEDSIEIGWTVNPSIFGDTKTRLYGRYSGDYENKASCTGPSCGFVQVSQTVSLGAVFTTISEYGGYQWGIELLLIKDNIDGHWWLYLGPDRIPVGYWPKELFSAGLADYANQVAWGGVTYMGAPMGSGHYPEEGYGGAAFVGRIRVADGPDPVHGVEKKKLFQMVNNKDCYNLIPADDKQLEPFGFYFGGPGGLACGTIN